VSSDADRTWGVWGEKCVVWTGLALVFMSSSDWVTEIIMNCG